MEIHPVIEVLGVFCRSIFRNYSESLTENQHLNRLWFCQHRTRALRIQKKHHEAVLKRRFQFPCFQLKPLGWIL